MAMIRSSDNPWLHRFAVFSAACTLFLIWVGGLVTTHGVGMSVPDWPTTYGYNMFLFPISKWEGGVFQEHSHRLVASGVGMLTVVLAVWLWLKEERAWLRWLGAAAVIAVSVQGILGGLRVTWMRDELGIFHATLAQMFLALMAALALGTSRWWRRVGAPKMAIYGGRGFRYLFATVTGLILVQLVLGASMRHQHAGLAIPDFPTAYGKLWPITDPVSVARYNEARGEPEALNPITAVQIHLQMAHRLAAFVIMAAVAWLAGAARRRLGWSCALTRLATLWLGLILLQAGLGAATIWSNKAADIATAHVAVGALSLVTGVLLSLIAFRVEPAGRAVPPASSPHSASSAPAPARGPVVKATA